MAPTAPRWQVLRDAAAVAAAARDRILAAAAAAIAARGEFHLVLAGGRTPEAAYRLLAADASDWTRWWVWFGDERCLPAGDPERNATLAAAALLDRVPIPQSQVCPIPAERGPEEAAAAYGALVAAAPPFDLVLLGLGEDGHTASLFPGHVHPPGALVVAVRGAPKPPPERVSLAPTSLARARERLFLVTGAGKRAALRAWRRGEPIPAAEVAATDPTTVLCDRAAADGG